MRRVLPVLLLLLPSSVSAQTAMPGPAGAGAAPPANAASMNPPAAGPAPAAGNPPQSSPPPPAPVSAGTAAAGSATGGTLGAPSVSPVPVSPPVPTAVPGQSSVPPLSPSTPSAAQTLPAAPPASLSPVTPGAVPLRLTAESAVALAARRNLSVLAALREVLAARSGVRSASALSPPIFTIGPALQAGGTTDGFLFQQPLELNGTRDARAGVARAQLHLSQAQALVQVQALVYTARLSFYALAQAQARLRLTQDLRVIAERFDAIARTQVALGARPGIEQRQTAIEVARARAQEALAFGQELAARAALNAYLGRAPLDPIETTLGADALGIPQQEAPPDLVQAQRRALAVRGEIAAAEATRDIPQAQARLSRAQGRPDIAPSFRISQITPTYMDAGLGVVITIPLDYGTRRNQIRQQEQTAEADTARITGTQAQVRLEVVQAASRLSAAQEALRGYDDGLIANAKAMLDDAQLGFRAGATTMISVLDAQRTYRAILGERLDALTQAALAQAELDRASGTIPPALLAQFQQEMDSEKETDKK